MKRRMGSVSTPIESQGLTVEEISVSPTRVRATNNNYLNVSRLETSQDSAAIQDEPLL